MQVDIAVDLSGRTQDARLGILAHRPAPVQATYLGYAGTTGAGFIDYVIADPIVLPFDQQPFYTEKIVHLPDYQANDSTRKIEGCDADLEAKPGCRTEDSVFCCFNNNFKITRPVFDVWIRLLRAVAGSVLWLSQDNAEAKENLHKVPPPRAGSIRRARYLRPGSSVDEHLARHRLADLFLDTLPYNAHTTASDALWAGLPLLTRRGASFAGRVAASLLPCRGPSGARRPTTSPSTRRWRCARARRRVARCLPAPPRAKPDGLPALRYRSLPPPYRRSLHHDVGAAATRREPAKLQRRALGGPVAR